MTYGNLFAVVYACGILTLLAVTVLLIRERRRALPLAIVGFAWLYAANMLINFSSHWQMSRQLETGGNSIGITVAIAGLVAAVIGTPFAVHYLGRKFRQTATRRQ